ncbi:MAG: IS4 family transposase [Victivallales bacterium]|nr:IS4 family transposase [Victivallales bacterium]
MHEGRYYPGLPHRFKRIIHAVDSSTIPLVANCMEWARHRRQKAAAKLHMDLNMQTFLPSFAIVRSAKTSDPKVAWELCAHLKAGEIAVYDKAYVDFKHLCHLDSRGIFWVTRAKDNMHYEVMGQQESVQGKETCSPSRNSEKVMGQQTSNCCPKAEKRKYKRKRIKIIRDLRIKLKNANSAKHYPHEFRLVEAEVEVKKKMVTMSFITNNLIWSAVTICELYQARWGVEVFFKEINSLLTSWGTMRTPYAGKYGSPY